MNEYIGRVDNQRTTMDDAVQDYLTFHEVNKASPYTVTNYRYTLLPFALWFRETCKLTFVDELRVKHLRLYINYLQVTPTKRGCPLADSSISQYALAISVFCHWLVSEGLIVKSTIENFKLPKSEQKEIVAFTRDDFAKLLLACEETDNRSPRLQKALTMRNRAMVTLLFDAGLRRSELMGLRLGDIDRQMRLLYVKRKGNKWQQVPVSYDGFKALHEYMTRHRPYLASLSAAGTGSKKDSPVFLSYRGDALTIKGLTLLFRRLRKRSGITDKPVYSHQGRRFMATTQLDAGRNPLDVQRQMGHTTLMMTNRYYSQTVTGLSKSHEQFSPTRKKKDDNISSSGMGSGYYEE